MELQFCERAWSRFVSQCPAHQRTGSVRFADFLSTSVAPPCRCGRHIDEFGHHRAKQGFLGDGGSLQEVVAVCVCLEGGARVTTTTFVRDLELDVPNVARDGRRLEGSEAFDWPLTQHWCLINKARLVVLAAEVEGRWSEETRSFIRSFGLGTCQI